MKKQISIIAAVVLVLTLFSCKGAVGPTGPDGVTPETGWYVQTYQYGVDSFTNFFDSRLWELNPDNVYGTDTSSNVGFYAGNEKRLLIQAILPQLPDGAVIQKAAISLKKSTYLVGTPVMTFYEIMNGWSETVCTWNDRINATAWTTPGGSPGTVKISNSVLIDSTDSIFITWTLDTTWVQKCYGGINTFGIVLMADDLTASNETIFYTKESVTVANRPIMTVYYTLP